MFAQFINRPVLATVISIILLILGIIGLNKLPLRQFPDIAPPSVIVTALYPGANAETVLRSVAPSLEESINGVENMTYMTSTASNDGSLSISVYFKLGTDPDQAAVNVQNRVAQASNQMPEEVLKAGINTTKQQNNLLMVVTLYAENEAYFDDIFAANYAEINVIPEIKRISGVAGAYILGGKKDYAMRIWLNPAQMAAYNLTPNEVTTAIQDKNLEAAPGRFGESSSESFEYIIKYKGKFKQSTDYENIIIRSNTDGSLLRLRDVANVELGSYTYGSTSKVQGKKAINIRVMQLSGSNANEIQIAVYELMKKASKDFPQGLEYFIIYNTKDTLDQSINQVVTTLIEAFIMVFLVVYLFLQDIRTTLIPAIAVPVSIVGTFFFMLLFGFSINILTLFALILAIGIVVDDAIVVVEAVHSKMERLPLSPKAATKSAMSEITGAIISITLVMAAVFLPVGFMEGSAGVFYRQFAFTLAIAIIISAVNALTLSPALAALILKEQHRPGQNSIPAKMSFKQKFFTGFNRGFTQITNKYLGSIRILIRHKWWSLAGLMLLVLTTLFLINDTKTGFIPSEDQGFIAISVSMPAGASLERTAAVMDQASDIINNLPFSKAVNAISGLNIITNSTNSSTGVIFVLLKPSKERGPVTDINQIMNQLRDELATLKEANFFVFTFPTVRGFSNIDGLDMVLQDKTGGDLNTFSSISTAFIDSLKQRPEIAVAYTTFRADYPQYELELDEIKAAQLQVNVRDVLQTMQSYFGAYQASDFNRFGKYYRVMIQAKKDDRTNLNAMDGIFVKNRFNEPVPINTLVTLKRVYGPETTSRYNLFNSIAINAISSPEYSSGDAIKAVEEVAAQQLPYGYSYEFSGMTREELATGGQSLIIFSLSLLFIYFLLAAQYESYILPLAVILSIPTGILGVFISIKMAGIDNNIYVQIALVMLIGLLAKNAILIVEFALQRRRAGKSLIFSVMEASKLRLRPIIMTSVAFIAGLIPMMNVKGPAAMGNHSISIGAAGGMLSGVVLGLFIIPVLFILFQLLHERIAGPVSNQDESEI